MSTAVVTALDIDMATVSAGVVMNINDSILYSIINGTVREYTIPKSFESIRSGLFYDCIRLEKITIPNNVKTIGERSFYNCNSLDKVAIPNGLESVDDFAFGNCSSLKTVYFMGKPTQIKSTAFSGCDSIDIWVPWATNAVSGAPWGATNAIIHYSTNYNINGEPIV